MGRPMAVPRVSSPRGFSPQGACGGVTRVEKSVVGWVEEDRDARSLEVDLCGGVVRTLSSTDAYVYCARWGLSVLAANAALNTPAPCNVMHARRSRLPRSMGGEGN